MAKRKKEGTGGPGDDLAVVIVAPSLDEAEQFRQLLEDHDISAVVAAGEAFEDVADALLEDVAAEAPSGGVAVLVPTDLLDEAGEVIADREEVDEFEDDEPVDDDDDMFDAMEVDLEDWESGGSPSPVAAEEDLLGVVGGELGLDDDDELGVDDDEFDDGN